MSNMLTRLLSRLPVFHRKSHNILFEREVALGYHSIQDVEQGGLKPLNREKESSLSAAEGAASYVAANKPSDVSEEAEELLDKLFDGLLDEGDAAKEDRSVVSDSENFALNREKESSLSAAEGAASYVAANKPSDVSEEAEELLDRLSDGLLDEGDAAKEDRPVVSDSENLADTWESSQEDALTEETRTVECAERLTDEQKLYLRAMGESGLSERKEIRAYVKKISPGTNVRSGLDVPFFDLAKETENEADQFLCCVKCSVPDGSTLCLYRLGELGKDVYRHLFLKDPVEAQVSVVLRRYASVEHGYGIRQTVRQLSAMPYFTGQGAEVEYYPSPKEFPAGDGKAEDGTADIVVALEKNGETVTYRYLYETGFGNELDFYDRCTRMAGISESIDIIVPNTAAKNAMKKKICRWMILVADGRYFLDHKVRVQLTTYYAIRDHKNDMEFPWLLSETVYPAGETR